MPKDPPHSNDPPESKESLAAHLRWLESLVDSHEGLARLSEADRVRLRVAAGRLALPDRLERRRHARATRKATHQEKRERDDAALEATSNRAKKRALAFPRPPEGLAIDSAQRALLEHQARPRRQDEQKRILDEPRPCYVCKAAFSDLHFHYDSLCPSCAELNWAKRHQTGELAGRVALVTGARVKIGYEIALMLLRSGARVIATTRFICDAARRFAKERDFSDWESRLELRPLDLRHTPQVEAFCADFLSRETRLDFLIHNACQTVRRPPAYYEEMAALEDPSALAPRVQQLVRSDFNANGVAVLGEPTQVSSLSQLDLLGEADQKSLFPVGMRDGEGQQLDLREQNSWRMELHEVSTLELLEVQLVNAVAPFVLNRHLKPLMLAVPTRDKHIVHVSAMEGQFYRSFKTTRHPHTNMAKAALNMLTRTSAADFAKDGIHMNSVDTGWVTDEDPLSKAVEKEESQRFAPPLDAIDGAARVLDPLLSGFESGQHCWGQFLKDYAPTRW